MISLSITLYHVLRYSPFNYRNTQREFVLHTTYTWGILSIAIPDKSRGQLSCSKACASDTKQYNLVPAYGQWRSLAGKVTAGLAKSNGSLPSGGWLKVTFGLTACRPTPGSAPGPTLGNEYRKNYTLFLNSGSGRNVASAASEASRWRNLSGWLRLSLIHISEPTRPY